MSRVITKKYFLIGLALFIVGAALLTISYIQQEFIYGRLGYSLIILIVLLYLKRLRDLSK